MKRFHRFFCFLLAAAAVATGAPARAQTAAATEAGHYISGLADKTLAIISNKSATKDQKQQELDRLFADNIDFKWVGRFVLGVNWRRATPQQQARYLAEYQKFLTLHYTSRFTEYTSGKYKVTGERDDGDNEYSVSMQIQSNDPGSEPVQVDYRVRREGNGFKIFDVIVEGVSLITTQRSEFASVVSNHSLDYLISELAEKSESGEAAKGGIGTP